MPRTRATVCRWRASKATRTVPRLSALVVSVIVPTYNEAESLPLLVDRLARALAGRDWELVVVDDGSPDGTASVAERLAPAHPGRVVRRAGKLWLASAARSRVRAARGDPTTVPARAV